MSFDISNLNKKVDLNEGEWIDDIPDMPGVRFRVRSSNYKPFKVAIAGLMRSNNKKMRKDEGMVDFTVSLGSPLANHILLDWDGVKNGGKAQKYDPKVALAILTSDDDLGIGQLFRHGVQYASDLVAERLLSATEEASGN